MIPHPRQSGLQPPRLLHCLRGTRRLLRNYTRKRKKKNCRGRQRSSTCDTEKLSLGRPFCFVRGECGLWACESHLSTFEAIMLPIPVGRQQTCARVSGLGGYLQTDQEKSALSSELLLLPKQEINQVSDRIRYGWGLRLRSERT